MGILYTLWLAAVILFVLGLCSMVFVYRVVWHLDGWQIFHVQLKTYFII